MSLPEFEFELSAQQYEVLGYPELRQGSPLSLILDAGILLPDPASDSWFTVQKEPIPEQLVKVGPATYAFSGQIKEADIIQDGDEQMATLLIQCHDIPIRVTCAPEVDGRLPYGTWETRYLTGVSRVQGIVEDDFSTPIGMPLGLTIWGFQRLTLSPNDPLFGQWHESDILLSSPYLYDRVVITAHVHRRGL